MFFLGGGMSLRAKRKGAVEHCTGKRLTKKCIYEKKTKYLVQVSDTVEHLNYHLGMFSLVVVNVVV